MNGFLLPGWNLAGRLPSLSALRAAGAYVAFAGTELFSWGGFSTPSTSIQAGNLMLVPRVIMISYADDVLNPDGSVGFSDYDRMEGVVQAISARVASAMPGAIVIDAPFSTPNPSPSYNILAYMPVCYVQPGVPVIGCDLLCVFVGTGVNQATSEFLDATLEATVDQLSGLAGYSVRIFESPGGTLEPGAVAMDDVVTAAAELGIDISVLGDNTDATEETIAQLIDDHYGVAI